MTLAYGGAFFFQDGNVQAELPVGSIGLPAVEIQKGRKPQMISAIIFDMDGTLYNETDVKMTAELETAVYLAGCCDSSPEAVYDIFRKVKSRVTSACRGLPEANDRAILQTARIYSDAFGKIPGWRSAVGLHCKFNRCAV